LEEQFITAGPLSKTSSHLAVSPGDIFIHILIVTFVCTLCCRLFLIRQKNLLYS